MKRNKNLGWGLLLAFVLWLVQMTVAAGAGLGRLLPLALASAACWAGATAWWLYRMERGAKPLEQLEETLKQWPQPQALEELRQEAGQQGQAGPLAQAMAGILEEVDGQIQLAGRMAAAEAAKDAQRRMADDICHSALPQVLPDLPSRSSFEVQGRLERGTADCSPFYDYFYIDPGLVCLVIGQVPGGSVAESLYMVVAQTTIRSRLRQGRSLAETMADVNAQLFDLGSQFSLHALVGTLSTADGMFHYVNAGEVQPLLVRNEDRYEWLDAPVYAPLGMNESVSYRTMELRLKQGDRLFFHTEGLGAIADREGTPFREQQLRADLNLSRGKGLEPGETLEFLQEKALVYSKTLEVGGYAAMLLEYRKGDKELAHCEVPGQPAYAAQVADFLKRQLDENGISKRHYARVAVVVDELFALCCRYVKRDTVLVECGVAPDAQMVTIRIAAMLDGQDPLDAAEMEEGPAQEAMAFVRAQADYVTFKPGSERDTITVVCYLG